LVNSF